MFKFLPEARGRTKKENVRTAELMLLDLRGKIPSLVSTSVRVNSEKADQSNYDLVLVCDFNDWEGLKEYAEHPLHQNVVEFIVKVRESRSCVDYEY
jgi:hypothetical protein